MGRDHLDITVRYALRGEGVGRFPSFRCYVIFLWSHIIIYLRAWSFKLIIFRVSDKFYILSPDPENMTFYSDSFIFQHKTNVNYPGITALEPGNLLHTFSTWNKWRYYPEIKHKTNINYSGITALEPGNMDCNVGCKKRGFICGESGIKTKNTKDIFDQLKLDCSTGTLILIRILSTHMSFEVLPKRCLSGFGLKWAKLS